VPINLVLKALAITESMESQIHDLIIEEEKREPKQTYEQINTVNKKVQVNF
jgi:hypothetical protein